MIVVMTPSGESTTAASCTKLRFSCAATVFIVVMELHVLSIINNHKILRAIIRSIAINVVNQLCPNQRATQVLLHYQAVLEHIATPVGRGMCWLIDKPIPSGILQAQSFEIMVGRPSFPRILLSGIDPRWSQCRTPSGKGISDAGSVDTKATGYIGATKTTIIQVLQNSEGWYFPPNLTWEGTRVDSILRIATSRAKALGWVLGKKFRAASGVCTAA